MFSVWVNESWMRAVLIERVTLLQMTTRRSHINDLSLLSNSAIRKRKMYGAVILSLASREWRSRKARVGTGRAYKPAKNQTINLELGAAVMPLGLND